MSNINSQEPSIDASYQVSVHLAKRFERKRFFKSANQKQELPMVAMFVNGSRHNEQSLERTFHRCFLPSFTSFGWGVSEEKIKMWKVKTTDTKWWQKLTLPLARWAKKKQTTTSHLESLNTKMTMTYADKNRSWLETGIAIRQG